MTINVNKKKKRKTISKMIITLRCPHCKQYMKYSPRKNLIRKRKSCVFCGKSFAINNDNVRSQSVEKITNKRLKKLEE